MTVAELLEGAPVGDILVLPQGWTIKCRPGHEVTDYQEAIGVYDRYEHSRGMFASSTSSHGLNDAQRRGFLASMIFALEVMPDEVEEMACGDGYD